MKKEKSKRNILNAFNCVSILKENYFISLHVTNKQQLYKLIFYFSYRNIK
jgi:hypothetical protein